MHWALKHFPLFVGIASLLLLILCGAMGAYSVRAQPEPTVFFEPASASIVINVANSVVVEVSTAGAVDVQFYELIIEYDETIAQLDSWQKGTFLPSSAIFKEENAPGRLRVAIVKLGPPAVSGDGSLLRLTFSAKQPGITPLLITKAVFASNTGAKTLPEVENGALSAAYDPALLPKVTLTGAVSLQGQVNRAGMPVQLALGSTYRIGPYPAVSTTATGANLDFGQVVADTYAITTNQPRYINISAGLGKTVAVGTGKTSLNPLWLWGGNAVWTDNVIDSADASLVGASFGRTTADLAPGESLDADVNFDGVVNLRDLALVAGNFDLTAAAAYADWIP